MVYGDESAGVEAFYFHSVVDDVSETVECASLLEFFFGFFDGGGYAEAESAAVVDFYL